MKRILTIIILVSLFLLLLTISNVYYIKNNIKFNIDNNKNILILGDSHTKCGINDKIIEKCANHSNSLQPYFFSYILLKQFIKSNPQIDTVLISFHFNSLTTEYDTTIYDSLYRVLPFLSFDEVKNLYKVKKLFYLAIIKFQYYRFFNPINKNRSIKGGYVDIKKNELSKLYYYQNEYEKGERDPLSKMQFKYLSKIKDLCINKKIKLILINMPIYKKEFHPNYNEFYALYNEFFSEIEFLDYSGFNLPIDSYVDIAHINYKGAKEFSNFLKNDEKFLKLVNIKD